MPGNARLTIIILSIWLTACASMPDHSNTLVFGTETKLAIDVSTSTTSQVPEVTVGYKRTEAVWLPLLANTGKKDERTPADCKEDCLYAGDQDKDTYSVLASFGADFGGEAGLTVDSTQAAKTTEGKPIEYQNSVSGGIAQYFATGLAARELAKRGGSALVSVQSANVASAETKAELLQQENASVKTQLTAIEQRIGTDKITAIKASVADKAKIDELYIETIRSKLAPNKTLDTARATLTAENLLKNENFKANLNSQLTNMKSAKKLDDLNNILDSIRLVGSNLPDNPLEAMHKFLSQ